MSADLVYRISSAVDFINSNVLDQKCRLVFYMRGSFLHIFVLACAFELFQVTENIDLVYNFYFMLTNCLHLLFNM